MAKKHTEKAPRHMWTKNEVREVYKLWVSKTKEETAKALGVTPMQLMHIVGEMRRAGIDLPKKHRKGHLRNLLEEMAKSGDFE